MNLPDFFSLLHSVAMDIALLAAGLFFLIRLYLVERRFEEKLTGHESRLRLSDKTADGNTSAAALPPAVDPCWQLADGSDYRRATSSQRHRLRVIGRLGKSAVMLALITGTCAGAGALFAANATGNLAMSAVVLSRCAIRFPMLGARAESECSDGMIATRSVSRQDMPGVTSLASNDGDIATVTLTY